MPYYSNIYHLKMYSRLVDGSKPSLLSPNKESMPYYSNIYHLKMYPRLADGCRPSLLYRMYVVSSPEAKPPDTTVYY